MKDASVVVGRVSALVDAAAVLTRATGRLDAVLERAVREVTAAQGTLLLAQQDAVMEELTPSQTEAWRDKAKSRAKVELELATGWGVGEVRDLIALGAMPVMVAVPVGAALRSGEASWRLVRSYLRACAHLPHELGASVANALFGDDPVVAATERLDSDRQFTGAVWVHKEFHRALAREVAKAEAGLPPEQRRKKSREKSTAEADVWGKLDEDGMGIFG